MADGMTPTEDAGEARVIVLNTCAIRENADNKLYGNLGHLKPLKDTRPDLQDRRRRLPRPEGPRRDPAQGPVGRRRRRHARAAAPARPAGPRRARGPQMDVREYTEVFPSALPAARGRRRSGRGCRSRRAATTPARSASCRSSAAPQRSRAIGRHPGRGAGARRPTGVVEVTLLGQNVNTYGRDVTVPGSSRRPLFADLLRAVDQVDGHPADPVHVAAPARLHARRDRGDGRRAERSASTSTSRCNRAPTAS